MSTSITTWLLPFGNETSPSGTVTTSFWASIITANPSTTAFALYCHPDCLNWTPTLTVGGWAQPTPPPGLSTGIYDLTIPSIEGQGYYPYTGTFSGTRYAGVQTVDRPYSVTDSKIWHCDVTETTRLTSCTLTEGLDGKVFAPETFVPESTVFSLTAMTVTITDGVEKLGAATATAMTGAAGTATVSHGTGLGATATATATSKSDAGALRVPGSVGTLGLLALVATFVLR